MPYPARGIPNFRVAGHSPGMAAKPTSITGSQIPQAGFGRHRSTWLVLRSQAFSLWKNKAEAEASANQSIAEI